MIIKVELERWNDFNGCVLFYQHVSVRLPCNVFRNGIGRYVKLIRRKYNTIKNSVPC